MSIPFRKIKLSLFLRRPLPGDNYALNDYSMPLPRRFLLTVHEVRLRVCPDRGQGAFAAVWP